MSFQKFVNTRYGQALICYTGQGHACLMTTHETGLMQVRTGTPLSVNIHLNRNEVGEFIVKQGRSSVMKENWTQYAFSDAAPTTRQKVLEMAHEAVNGLLKDFPKEMAAEDVENLKRNIGYAQRELDELEEKVLPIRERKAGLEAQLEEAESVLNSLQ